MGYATGLGGEGGDWMGKLPDLGGTRRGGGEAGWDEYQLWEGRSNSEHLADEPQFFIFVHSVRVK